jgi:two-component system, NarL family, sensor kinase
VVRHAHAHACTIRVVLNDALWLEVVDDGCGLLAKHPAGVGLRSMQERAAELGGTCLIETIQSGGTRVQARLPLPMPIGA